MLRQARWTATKADEHAVSTAALGPLKSKQYEIRLAAMESEEPVLLYTSIERGRGSWSEQRVIPARDPREDGRPRPRDPLQWQPRILDRLIRDLQEEPLLRVHPRRLARRDPEEVRVELVDPLDEAPPARVRLAGLAWLRIKERLDFQRSAGTSVIAFTPASRSLQKTSGLSALPGNRHPIPIMAMGSLLPVWLLRFMSRIWRVGRVLSCVFRAVRSTAMARPTMALPNLGAGLHPQSPHPTHSGIV